MPNGSFPKSPQPTEDRLRALAASFVPPGSSWEIVPYGQGNINDTYLVTIRPLGEDSSPGVPEGEGSPKKFILQRLNSKVFPHPELVISNLRVVTEHVSRRLKENLPLSGRRFELPRLLLTRDGQDYLLDSEGWFWRALTFIEGGETFETLRDERQAREAGYALGLFHRLVSDLPPEHLADTLPGFHETPRYLRQYDLVRAGNGFRQSPEVAFCMRFVEERRQWAKVLEEAKAKNKLPVRIIHGDPKVNNVLFDQKTGQALALVDLDTVKPGLVHYDLGDCLRSACNPLGEETRDWEKVTFDPDLARALLSGYLVQAREFLTDQDYAFIYQAIRLLAFELGLRFFTDYLAGNVYFRAAWREHNLLRALVQFKLTLSIESQALILESLIQELRGKMKMAGAGGG